MTYRFCHRCHADLPPHDEGTLIFCTQCGAPEVLLSEDLLTQVQMQDKAATDDLATGPVLRDPQSLVWAGALRCAALAGAVTAALLFITLLVPQVFFLTCLWALISPVVVIGLFQSRYPLTPITTGFGARLGFLTGLAVALVFNVINTATLLIARFGVHAMGDSDKQLTVRLDQFRSQITAQPGSPDILLSLLNHLAQPEFRAGFLLVGVAMLAAMLVVVTTIGGAFAGFARSRSRA